MVGIQGVKPYLELPVYLNKISAMNQLGGVDDTR
jgi:hypothetical protein